MNTYTVLIYPAGDNEPITFPDVEADSEQDAILIISAGWPPKRRVRNTAVIKTGE